MPPETRMGCDLLEKMMGHAGRGVIEASDLRPDMYASTEAKAHALRGYGWRSFFAA